MKIAIFIIKALLLSACNRNETSRNNRKEDGNTLRTESCSCEKTIKNDMTIYATTIHLEKENNILVFRCASVLVGTASVSDINGNNEHCEAIYEIQCSSSTDTRLPLSKNFKYFTDKLQQQNLFFEDLKKDESSYFELTLDPDRNINYISKLNIN